MRTSPGAPQLQRLHGRAQRLRRGFDRHPGLGRRQLDPRIAQHQQAAAQTEHDQQQREERAGPGVQGPKDSHQKRFATVSVTVRPRPAQ
nr:hypothetical protein [Phenylobacterium sp. J426]